MDDRETRSAEIAAERAVIDLVENLLRCMSGGQAGFWYKVMPDIYNAAIADQDLREKNGKGLSTEAIERCLSWKTERWKDSEELSSNQLNILEAESSLQNAYASALRVVAYRVSGTIKAQEARAEASFHDAMKNRDAALERFRKGQRY